MSKKKTSHPDEPRRVLPPPSEASRWIASNELKGTDLEEVFREHHHNRVHQPAIGRFIILRNPLRENDRCLALTWEYQDPELGQLTATYPTHDGLLLYERPEKMVASWLPGEWAIAMTPINWTWWHLKAWFEYAIRTAEHNASLGRADDSSPNAPSSRVLIKHAIIIFRHLRLNQGLKGLPTEEPVGEITPRDCVILLGNYLDALEQALESPSPSAGSHWLTFPTKRRALLELLDGKGEVPVEKVLKAIYGLRWNESRDALAHLKKETNKSLAEKDYTCTISQKGETLSLLPL